MWGRLIAFLRKNTGVDCKWCGAHAQGPYCSETCKTADRASWEDWTAIK